MRYWLLILALILGLMTLVTGLVLLSARHEIVAR